MFSLRPQDWLRRRASLGLRGGPERRGSRGRRHRPELVTLEDRTLLTVFVKSHYDGLGFTASGYVPPDTNGAAGPSSYVETVNQNIAIYSPKETGANSVTSSLQDFFFVEGGLPVADAGSGLSDPIVVWDDQVQRFIVGDQDVNFDSHVSRFDIAVSRTANPATLSAADWYFSSVSTTENDGADLVFDADYPGNFGYNHDAFVFTLNMFDANGSGGEDPDQGIGGGPIEGAHVLVTALKIADLIAGNPITAYQNVVEGFNLRPSVMHDAQAGDPIWLVGAGEDGQSVDVVKMTDALSDTASFTTYSLAVQPFDEVVPPLQPDGSPLTFNIDAHILKAAQWHNTLVATHSVAVSPTQDVARWYAIDVTGGVPSLSDQGDVGAGDNTYATYPAIDINAAGQVGMTYMLSGLEPGQFMSLYVTGRNPGDAAGTMQEPVLVRAGVTNYTDFAPGGRAGDLSGISVDADGSFWASNEYARALVGFANWGTAIAHFALVDAIDPAATDLAVAVDAPDQGVGDSDLTYTVTVTNLGPNAAGAVAVASPLPDLVTFVSELHPGGWSVTAPPPGANGVVRFLAPRLAAGASATFTITVHVDLDFGRANIPNSYLASEATVTTSTVDRVPANDVATASTFVPSLVDMALVGSGPEQAIAGTDLTYTFTLTNLGPNVAFFPQLFSAIPSGATFVDATVPAGWSFGTFLGGGTELFFQAFAFGLAAGSSAPITITVHLDPDYATYPLLTSTTTASSFGAIDLDPSNDTVAISTALVGLADLAVSQSGPGSVVAGASATYTIVVTNRGPSDAYTVALTGQVPERAKFVSLAELSGPAFSLTMPAVGGVGAWVASGQKLAPGESAVFRLVVAVDASAGPGSTLTAQVRAQARTPDPSAANNTSRVLAGITAQADLSIRAVALTPALSPAGGRLTFQVTIANNGPSDALNVTWTNLLPAGASIVSASQTGGPTFTLRKTATTESGTIQRLAARATATFTVVIQVPGGPKAGATGLSTFQVSSSTPDPLAGNNQVVIGLLATRTGASPLAVALPDPKKDNRP